MKGPKSMNASISSPESIPQADLVLKVEDFEPGGCLEISDDVKAAIAKAIEESENAS